MSISILLLNAFPDKKIKSLGNKYLLKITKDSNLIDYNINFFNTLYSNPEIVIVGGFDSKRLQKYVDNKYNNKIICIDHDFDINYNIGKSILCGIDYISRPSCLMVHSGVLLKKNINFHTESDISFAITSSNNKSNIGCIIDTANNIVHCHYGLPYQLYDMLYIDHKDMYKFRQILQEKKNIDKLFLFELINLCIDNNINIKSNNILSKNISIIDSNSKIRNIKKYV